MKAAMSGMTDKIPLQALGRVRVGSNEPALRATVNKVLAEGVVVEHLHVIGSGGVPDRENLRRVEPGGEPGSSTPFRTSPSRSSRAATSQASTRRPATSSWALCSSTSSSRSRAASGPRR